MTPVKNSRGEFARNFSLPNLGLIYIPSRIGLSKDTLMS